MDWRVIHMTKQFIIGSVRLVLFWTFQNCLLVLKRKISFPTKVEISRISSPNSFPSLSCHPGCHHFISIWDQGGDQGEEIFLVPLSPVQCFVHLSCRLLLYWNNTGGVKHQIESSAVRNCHPKEFDFKRQTLPLSPLFVLDCLCLKFLSTFYPWV